MSDIPWTELAETISRMTPDERNRLRGILNGRTGVETTGDPLLGLMADEAPLLDKVVGEAMASRENDPLEGVS